MGGLKLPTIPNPGQIKRGIEDLMGGGYADSAIEVTGEELGTDNPWISDFETTWGNVTPYQDPLDPRRMKPTVLQEENTTVLGGAPDGKRFNPDTGELEDVPSSSSYGDLRPEFESIRDAEGNLLPGFEYTPSQYDVAEMTKWYDPAVEAIGVRELDLLGQADQESARQQAMAESNMAMRGGIRGGARERLATASAEDALMNRQGVRGQADSDLLNMEYLLGQQKSDIAGSNVDLENEALRANLAAKYGDVVAGNAFDTFLYGEDIKKLGADAAADAIEGSGKK